ncbi:MAG TPA: neutral zinc metallopeptidase [Gaiellaceae bacterium]|nr:neutral zinc metallopeptidase [Gaiellaceae bacterium]
MKWRGRGGAGRIEDRRGMGGGSFGGGGMPFPMGRVGGGGIGTILIVLLFLFLSSRGGGSGLGIDPGTGQFAPAPGSSSTDLNKPPADDPAKFIDFVAGDVDATWQKIFAESGKKYEQPVVVLYEKGVQSACGNTPSTVGPFYCPRDHKVYLDLTFMEQLQQQLNAPGDFAQGYIVAHEIGHHVQNLLGVMDDVSREQQENPDSANELSVRVELQADCLAGVWGHSAYAKGDLLESGDVEEGLNAAAAVGDDRIQKQAGRGVDPDSFTHGSSEQRVKWFKAGFDSGDPTACDTFKGDV